MQQNNAARGGRRQRRDRLGQKLHEHGQKNNGHEKGNMFTVLGVCLTPDGLKKLESKENSL